ncbi:MAG: glycogen debranching enzyme N-terminal domain-containing protein, partial [Deltaproteobacteria bacterium]|nr:glycogen debranching enzyme N-terminal domain-containing protein [Deltaproteobacteria bacterium]
AVTALSWRLFAPSGRARLFVRPFFSGRDYHSMHHENPAFRFEPESANGRLLWRPYQGVPGAISISNGNYSHQPTWYRNFLYEEERARGLDYTEDLASPGTLAWDLMGSEAVWILAAEGFDNKALPKDKNADECLKVLREADQKRRSGFASTLHRSANAYLVRRGNGKTVVAGYPWFTDWGRDTFIALRGLCLATGRMDDARDILLRWANTVSEGMLPNRFPDQGDTPEYNSVDASLWYVIAVHEFLQAVKAQRRKLSISDKRALAQAVESILTGYSRGTRFGIRLDEDGLLAAGVPGVQLTWMDAKVGDWVVTPRTGKPVEVQALWLNALRVGSQFSDGWKELLQRGREAFRVRFWNDQAGFLYDVVDADHQQGKVDASFRPNQIFAVGGLPLALLEGERASKVVNAVESRLWTPIGLKSLGPEEPGYTPHYEGGVRERDGAYHQGTVWPWLLGPFVEAWVRVRGGTSDAKREAREKFFEPLVQHVNEAGLGHVSEIADADPPHTPRGCPFQAWSVGEALRLDRVVLAGVEEQNTSHAIVRK